MKNINIKNQYYKLILKKILDNIYYICYNAYRNISTEGDELLKELPLRMLRKRQVRAYRRFRMY